MLFFTSDTHFSHKNVIKYNNRPFESVKDMDETLVKNWNSKVSNNDTVYHLGDFGFCSSTKINTLLDSLNGDIVLIKGNHDYKMSADNLSRFKSVHNYFEFSVSDKSANRGSQDITLCHYAARVWNKSHYGAWMLFGHSHGSLDEYKDQLSIDVGVDTNDYYPVSYSEVKLKMAKRCWKPIDHHR